MKIITVKTLFNLIVLTVNGPETSGVFADNNFGNAGENQPIIHPCDNIIKLAKIGIKKCVNNKTRIKLDLRTVVEKKVIW